MPRSQRNDNFIDKTFTVIADIFLKVLPTSQREKQAFTYYRDGMSAQAEGEYAEALQNYFEAPLAAHKQQNKTGDAHIDADKHSMLAPAPPQTSVHLTCSAGNRF